jgi:hypothetical protein
MSKIRVIILSFVLCALCSLLGFRHGYKKGYFQAALEESKMAISVIQTDHTNPQLKEYLKGRIYYNIHTKFPNDKGYKLKEDWDFGMIDTVQLRGIEYHKDPSYNIISFEDACK